MKIQDLQKGDLLRGQYPDEISPTWFLLLEDPRFVKSRFMSRIEVSTCRVENNRCYPMILSYYVDDDISTYYLKLFSRVQSATCLR